MPPEHRHAHGHDHDHDHDHGHGHGHGHHAVPPPADGSATWAYAASLIVNALFVVAEFGAGFWASSTALMADAGHNLSDVLALAMAWGAASLARRPPRGRYTYGLQSTSILAALANAVLLLLACGAIALEAAQRLSNPPAVASGVVMLVAGVGIVVNGLSAWWLSRGHQHDLNRRGAYLHMVADAAVSLGVVLAGLGVRLTGWTVLDPLASLVIVVVIVLGTWGLLRDALRLSLHAVPAQVDAAAVADYLRALPGVVEVHDLHIWGMSTTECALTAHLVVPDATRAPSLEAVADTLDERFGIHHCTLQIEARACALDCAHRKPLASASAV